MGSVILEALYRGDTDAAEAAATEQELDVFEAAALGRIERVRTLLAEDRELARAWTDGGFTPLHYAAFFDGPEIARLLIERGADVSVISRHPQLVVAPIHSAAASRQLETVRALLDAGADPNVKKEGGLTALHSAGQHGDRAMAELLLERGADTSSATDDGRTPADLAREHGHEEVAALLESRSRAPAA